MKNLRRNFERFCFQNRTKGIPNLMLFISLGSAVVYVLTQLTGNYALYYALSFNRELILQGQVWRLLTYVFAYDAGSMLLTAISLLCYFSLGRAMENLWGTLRFNLFYFTGVVLMDVFCMLFGGAANVYHLNLSLFLGYATLYPDARFLLMFIIPVKAWIFALVYLVLTAYDVYNLAIHHYGIYCLFPLVSIANYFLFFGKDVANVIPLSWRVNSRRLARKKAQQTGTIPFAGSYQATKATVQAPYTHKCRICGRTDVTNPELEFRYCSRCQGYHCYCEEHISNHEHVE